MASPVTIQPSTIDNYIRLDYPNNNSSTSTTLFIGTLAASRYRSMLAFDFSAVVPAGTTITLARLSLCCAVYLASRTITIYRLLRTAWVENQATWNVYKTGSAWGTVGALNTTTDVTTTDAATAASVPTNNWLDETVTAQVQTALDSVAGVAHFLVTDVGGVATGGNNYYSRKYATAANRPKLYIEYTVPVVSSQVNIGDTFKAIVWAGSKINIGDAWKAIVAVSVNIGDAWKAVYTAVKERKLGFSGTPAAEASAQGYQEATQWQCAASGNVDEIRVYGGANGNIKVGIYADSAAYPGALLGSSAGVAVTSGAWTTVPLASSVAVTAGTYYWLAEICESANVATQHAQAGYSLYYSASAYSGGLSNPYPAGGGAFAGYNILAGFG